MGIWDNLLLILRRNRCRNIFRISIPKLPLKSKNFLKWKITERKTDNFQLNKEGTRLSDSRSVMVPLLIHAKIALHFFTGWCLQSWKLERSQTNNFLKNSISFLNRTWSCQFGTLLLTSILQFPCLFCGLFLLRKVKISVLMLYLFLMHLATFKIFLSRIGITSMVFVISNSFPCRLLNLSCSQTCFFHLSIPSSVKAPFALLLKIIWFLVTAKHLQRQISCHNASTSRKLKIP